jgi:chemotaxis protein MotB
MRGRSGSTSFYEKINIWPGFTDIMVGLLLLFVFVVTLFTITETILSRSLSKKDTELERLHQEISLKTEEVERLKSEVSRLTDLFGAEEKKTANLEELLASLRKELENALAQVEEKTALLSEKEDIIASQAEKLASATAKIEESDKEAESQRLKISSLLSQIEERNSLLDERKEQITALNLRISEADKELSGAKSELKQASSTISELRARIEVLNRTMAALNERLAGYVAEVERLNKLLAEAKEADTKQKTRAAALQGEISSLRSKLDDISKKLAEAKVQEKKRFRLSQLVNLIGQKDQEIDRLRKLAKYRSEFLAKLQRVFNEVPDIKVRGDRFVFQAEILFASGRADLNEGGKRELDKFIKIYKEMETKLPADLPLIILVQGHTDDVPISSSRYPSNWELSSARAMAVVRYLIDGGIPPNRVAAAALGQFHPVAKGPTREARKLNRRIEIKITTL